MATNGLSAATGLRLAADQLRHGGDRRHQRIGVGEELVLQPQRVQPLHPLRQRGAHQRANQRLRKRTIEREIGLGYTGGSGEAALIGRIVTAERSDILERPRLAAHHPLAGREIGVGGILGLVLEHRLVEPGRKRIDQVDIARELAVLLFCHASGYEDAQVAHGLVDGVDDGLAVGSDLLDALIEIENPSERLLRRRDVVALRAEHHDRRADVAQVDRGSVRCLESCRRRDCCR